jgi:hypothetical protein
MSPASHEIFGQFVVSDETLHECVWNTEHASKTLGDSGNGRRSDLQCLHGVGPSIGGGR